MEDVAALGEKQHKYNIYMENKSAHTVGHIDSETAKKWLDWNLGELFVVACDGEEGGTIVPV